MDTHICAQCKKQLGASCCEITAEQQLATLTHADIERISQHVGWASSRFCEEEWLSDEEANAYETRRPLFDGYFRHGPRRLTLKQRGGGCVFLGTTGCTLPFDVRPIACRLYPFEPRFNGSVGLVPERFGDLQAARVSGEACLAVEEAVDLNALMKRFHVTAAELHALALQLRDEVRAHARSCAPGFR